MTVLEASRKLQQAHPELYITDGVDYDEDLFVFTAVDDPSATQYDDPFYSVNKRTGEIKPFLPILNLKKFSEAQRTRLLKGGGL